MAYTKYDFDADVKKAGEKFDAKIKAEKDAKKRAPLEAERSKAVGALLTTNMKAIRDAAQKTYFPKLDQIYVQAKEHLKSAKLEVDRMQTVQGKSALSEDKVKGAIVMLKDLAEKAIKENLDFGGAWATYRGGNSQAKGVTSKDSSEFTTLRTKLMGDSKEYIAKAEKIKEYVTQAEELAKTAHKFAVGFETDAEDAQDEATKTVEKLDAMKKGVEELVTKANKMLKSIATNAADKTAVEDVLNKMPGFWQDALAGQKEAKAKVKTMELTLKQAQDRIGIAFATKAPVKTLLDGAKATNAAALTKVDELTKALQAATVPMAAINKKLYELTAA